MKKLFIGAAISMVFSSLASQTISSEMISLGNFVRRMYEASPFEGVKVVEDYNNSYLISLVMLEKAKYPNDIIMNKVANTKARSNVSKFLNGSEISTDFIVQTQEKKTDTVRMEVITYDIIKEKSVGMVDALETLISFSTGDNKYYVYVLFKAYKDFNKR